MHLLLIDGLNFVRRIFAAVPQNEDAELHFEAVTHSCKASLARALSQHSPSHVICVFDGGGENRRRLRHPEYKQNRKPMPESLHQGLEALRREFDAMHVRSISYEGYEADDILATIVQRVTSTGVYVTILSTDKAICQLLSDHVQVYDHFQKKFLDEFWLEKRFGVKPGQLLDFFALSGDSSLSVPGVKSIGQHTAAKLLQDFGSLDGIYAHLEEMPARLRKLLNQGKESAYFAQELLAFETEHDLGLNLQSFRYPEQQRPPASTESAND